MKEDFEALRNPEIGEARINKKFKESQTKAWYKLSREHPFVYPSQGLLQTPHDHLDYQGIHMLPHETVVKTLKLRLYFLELFNHPYRIQFLKKVIRASKKSFRF